MTIWHFGYKIKFQWRIKLVWSFKRYGSQPTTQLVIFNECWVVAFEFISATCDLKKNVFCHPLCQRDINIFVKCLCFCSSYHIRPPISASSLRRLRSSQRYDFSCLVLGQPWSTLDPLLLLVGHSGITSLLLFVRLFYLLSFPRLSLLP